LIFWIFAFLIFLVGMLMMTVAVLGAFRSPFPKLNKPGILWWPALGLFVVAIVISLMPLVVAYSSCESDCDVIDGGEATEEYNKNVKVMYDNCVKSQQGEAKKRVVDAGGARAEIDAAGAAALPDAQSTCKAMVRAACVSACYSPVKPNTN